MEEIVNISENGEFCDYSDTATGNINSHISSENEEYDVLLMKRQKAAQGLIFLLL